MMESKFCFICLNKVFVSFTYGQCPICKKDSYFYPSLQSIFKKCIELAEYDSQNFIQHLNKSFEVLYIMGYEYDSCLNIVNNMFIKLMRYKNSQEWNKFFYQFIKPKIEWGVWKK